MTQEEKAKAYDEAIRKAESLYKVSEPMSGCNVILETIFPELAESEDEKVRKSLLDYLYTLPNHFSHNGGLVIDWIAWLKKQSNPTDKIEPKFKIGHWVISTLPGIKYPHLITDIQDGYYIFGEDDDRAHIASNDNILKLWAIEDAKPGDVLVVDSWSDYPSSFVAIYKKQNEKDFDSYCFVGFDGKFYKGENGHFTEEIHPATKEQRDLLFQKMEEAGYEWDFKKKELKKVEPKFKVGDWVKDCNYKGEPTYEIQGIDSKCYICRYIGEENLGDRSIMHFSLNNPYLKLVEQHPTWSEEDETKYKEWYDFIRWFVEQRIDKFTHIPSDDDIHKWGDNILNHAGKVLEQNLTEWSEEDEVKLKSACALIRNTNLNGNEGVVGSTIDYLKSLRSKIKSSGSRVKGRCID